MEIKFKNAKLQSLATSEGALKKRYSPKLAKQVQIRLFQLMSAGNLEDLLLMPGKWKQLRGDRKGQYSARLTDGERLVVKPTQPVPYKEDGGIDEGQVQSITVIAIENYH